MNHLVQHPALEAELHPDLLGSRGTPRLRSNLATGIFGPAKNQLREWVLLFACLFCFFDSRLFLFLPVLPFLLPFCFFVFFCLFCFFGFWGANSGREESTPPQSQLQSAAQKAPPQKGVRSAFWAPGRGSPRVRP